MRIRITRPDERTSPARGRGHRRDSIGIQVRYAIAILVSLIAAYGATKAYLTSEDLKASLATQTRNRAANVVLWCNSINETRDYDRAFVARVTRGRVSYALPDLPCAQIVSGTLASTRPRR